MGAGSRGLRVVGAPGAGAMLQCRRVTDGAGEGDPKASDDGYDATP